MQMAIKTEKGQNYLKGLIFMNLEPDEETIDVYLGVDDYTNILPLTKFDLDELETNKLKYYKNGEIECSIVLWVPTGAINIETIDYMLYVPEYGCDGVIDLPKEEKEQIVQYLIDEKVVDKEGNVLRTH